MIVIGVDPGECCGVACLSKTGSDKRYLFSRVIDGDDLGEILSILDKYKPSVVVVEWQHSFKFRRLEKLFARRYLWEMAAKMKGIKVEIISPSTWQSYWRIRGKDMYNTIAKSVVHGYIGKYVNIKPDEDVAVLISEWWLNNN